MVGRASSFGVLGLEAGADAASVEQAYKRLIKQHQPDREGGDAVRAAEITRAYRELRDRKAPVDPLEFNDEYRGGRTHAANHEPLGGEGAGPGAPRSGDVDA
jgi:curved DNA-binding protein CbpA